MPLIYIYTYTYVFKYMHVKQSLSNELFSLSLKSQCKLNYVKNQIQNSTTKFVVKFDLKLINFWLKGDRNSIAAYVEDWPGSALAE